MLLSTEIAQQISSYLLRHCVLGGCVYYFIMSRDMETVIVKQVEGFFDRVFLCG